MKITNSHTCTYIRWWVYDTRIKVRGLLSNVRGKYGSNQTRKSLERIKRELDIMFRAENLNRLTPPRTRKAMRKGFNDVFYKHIEGQEKSYKKGEEEGI